MKGWGNYRFQRKKRKKRAQPNTERTLGVLLKYRGSKAIVRFHDGASYSIPSKALKKIGVKPGDRFRLIIIRLSGAIQDIRVETMPEARPPMRPRAMPKVVMREGRKLTTRK